MQDSLGTDIISIKIYQYPDPDFLNNEFNLE